MDAARANDGVDKEDMRAAQANAMFDWAAYRRSFPDTLPHAAIKTMLSEYALLVGRITRHLGTAVAFPVTLAEGEAISKQAQEFVCATRSRFWGRCTPPRCRSSWPTC